MFRRLTGPSILNFLDTSCPLGRAVFGFALGVTIGAAIGSAFTCCIGGRVNYTLRPKDGALVRGLYESVFC